MKRDKTRVDKKKKNIGEKYDVENNADNTFLVVKRMGNTTIPITSCLQ